MTPKRVLPGPTPRRRGFTLLEMLITMIVVAILMAVALPNMRDFSRGGAATAQANGLLGNLNVARSEALKSASTVRVSAASGGWANGWTVALDRNMNSIVDADDRVIVEIGKIKSGFTLSATTDDAAGAAVNTFFFSPTGALQAPTTSVRFTLKRPDDSAGNRKCVAVDPSGRAESRRGGATCA